MKLKAALLIFVVSIIVYSNSLGGEFIYDDEYFVAKNINIRNLKNIPSYFSNRTTVAFAGLSEDVYRPLTTVSFALNYFFGRLNTFGYHLVNVIFHAMNAALLFLFLYMLTNRLSLALFSSLLFSCQPVHTEAVVWISGRGNVLFLFFYLLSLIYYMKFLKAPKQRYYLYSVACCAVSLFSKEMAVTLPVILVGYDIHFNSRDNLKNRISRYLPYFALTLFYLLIRSSALGRTSQCEWWGCSPYYTFVTMLRVVVDYIKLLIWPVNLCAFYSIDISTSIFDPHVLAPLGILALIAVSWISAFKRSKTASFAFTWFFVTLIPVSNVVPLKALMAERFLYLPSIGFCLALALFVEKLGAVRLKGVIKNGKMIASAILAMIVVLYSVRTMERNEDWRDSLALTESIIKVSPMNPWAYHSLGAAYLRMGKFEEAVTPLRKSIALSWNFVEPRASLGFAYRELGRFEDSARLLKEAVSMKPGSIEAINSLGVTYSRMKKYDEGAKEFQKTVKLDPTYVAGYLNLGATYERMGRDDKALEQYTAIEKHTNSVQDIAISYIRIGDLYRRAKKKPEALIYYNKALQLCGRNLEDLRKVIVERLGGRMPPEKGKY